MGTSSKTNIENRADSYKALHILAYSMLVGMIAIILYALQSQCLGKFFSVATVGVMLASATLVIGGALGFLFGIPKTLQQEGTIEGAENLDNSNQSESRFKPAGYSVNTNLEQISDWLTKMLVGVGLTQIYAVPGKLQEITRYVAKGMGGSQIDQIFVLTVLLFFVVVGFLFGYLWTRLFLAGALRRADLSALGALKNRIVQTNEKFEKFKKQTELDVEALNMANQQLNPSPDLDDFSQDQLNAAIAAASRPIRAQIFSSAWDVRSKNWRDAESKPKMELTIPIFKALIHNDPEKRYHMNHGQLGFALKDKIVPDWAGAEAELNKAIDIRGDWHVHSWLFYEFARANCRIMLDSSFMKGKLSDPQTQKKILDDLQAASHANLFKLMEADPEISKWMKINKLGKSDIII